MKETTQVFTVLAEYSVQQGVTFNSNFLEANVINILLLLSGLIYVLKQFLGSILSIRQKKVLSAIQEAEERLQQANLRLEESIKQLSQAQIVTVQIKEEAKLTAQKVRESILEQGTFDIKRLTTASKMSIANAENQVKEQIQQQIISLAINRVTIQLQNQITPAIQSQIIDNGIAQLGGRI